MTLDALGEERRLLAVVCLGVGSTRGAEGVERNALLGEEIEHFRRGGAVHRVRELARFVVDSRHAQLPDHIDLRAAGGGKQEKVNLLNAKL